MGQRGLRTYYHEYLLGLLKLNDIPQVGGNP